MKTINVIEIISSDSDSTIDFTLENHVFRKINIFSFFSILKGLCHLKIIEVKVPKYIEFYKL